MSVNNGVISYPIVMKDITKVLGISTNKMSVACRSGNINKYSIIKPIDIATSGEKLAKDKFIGTAADNLAGYYYGLKASVGMEWSIEMHNANWSYDKRPRGTVGVSPCRRSDFEGYDHYARPTLYGTIITPFSNKIIYTHTTPFEVRLAYNSLNNTTGIDVFNCCNVNSITSWWLCVIIDSYVAVMRDSNGYCQQLYPIQQGEIIYKCPELPASLKTYSQARKISFFLAPLSDSALEDVRNLRNGGWVLFEQGYRADIQAITIPEAVGYQMEFTTAAVDYGKPVISSVTYNSKKASIVISIDFEKNCEPAQDTDYRLYLYMTDTDSLVFDLYGGTNKGDFTVYIPKSQLGIKEGTFGYTAILYGYANGIQTDNALTALAGQLTI